MKQELRLLMVEDSAKDAELLAHQVGENGYQVHTLRVDSLDILKHALTSARWDLVMCDYSLPGFTAREALAAVRAEGPDLPFIVVSGSVGEEVAVGLIQAGAFDFVLKGNPARLAAAVDRAMRDAGDRADRRRAEEMVSYLAAIVDSTDDAVIGNDLNGLVLSWNGGAERLYGYTAAEMSRQPMSVIIPDDRREEMQVILDRMRKGWRVERLETLRRHKNGNLVQVSLTVSPIRNAAGQVIGASAISRDISERKRAELETREMLNKLNAALGEIRTLSGLLPICTSCKRIRDEQGDWQEIESYIADRSRAEFSHSICPDCAHQLYPEFCTEMLVHT